MSTIEKINNCKIDRAIEEFKFRTMVERDIFNYLIKDVNFFKKFDDVKKDIPRATRYYYKNVKTYIEEEISK